MPAPGCHPEYFHPVPVLERVVQPEFHFLVYGHSHLPPDLEMCQYIFDPGTGRQVQDGHPFCIRGKFIPQDAVQSDMNLQIALPAQSFQFYNKKPPG